MAFKILIVDDEEGIREMLHRAMLNWSFMADYAPGPKEALMLMKMHKYDIIITDKNMRCFIKILIKIKPIYN